MFVVSIVWLFGFYGWFIPRHLRANESVMREHLQLNGLTPIKMVDVNGWSSTATWRVIQKDSKGKLVTKTIDVRVHRGNYIIQVHQ